MGRRLLAIVLAASSGCAFVVHRNTQALKIDSDPPGAVASLGGVTCVTPCELRAPRSRDADVLLSTEGLAPSAVRFRSRLSETTLLNLVLTPPIALLGVAVDVATGAAYDLVPAAARISLFPSPEGTGTPGAPREPTELSPRSPERVAINFWFGGADSRIEEHQALLQVGVLGTYRLAGPWVLGLAADAGTDSFGWIEPALTESTVSLVGGLSTPLTRNTRFGALVQFGRHAYGMEQGSASFAAIGGRAELSAVFGDAFLLGIYGGYLWDLGRETLGGPWVTPVEVGGGTVSGGFSIGFVLR